MTRRVDNGLVVPIGRAATYDGGPKFVYDMVTPRDRKVPAVKQSVRVTFIILGFVVAGFALGFMLETVFGASDSGAPPAGGLLGLGLGTALAALTAD